jgi:hypothetical protein
LSSLSVREGDELDMYCCGNNHVPLRMANRARKISAAILAIHTRLPFLHGGAGLSEPTILIATCCMT